MRIAAARKTVLINAVSLLLLVLSMHSYAHSGEPLSTTMRFDRISVADGLAQSSIMAIAQDKTGFMWFASESGLDRYDGFTFKHYRAERGNPNALASDFVRDLSVANDGSLWIATDGGGVSRWDPTNDNITTYRHDADDQSSLATDRIKTILAGDDGITWVGTRDAGLDRLDVSTGEVTHFSHVSDDANSLSNNEIFALALDDNGSLWIGTRLGLNRLDVDSGEITRIAADANGADDVLLDSIRSLLLDHDGSLWVGTSGAGLCKFNSESQSCSRYRHDADDPGSLSSNRVETIFEDESNRLWIGTDKGLNLMNSDTGRFAVYKHDTTDAASLGGDSIFSIFQDRGGLLWVGTRTSGISKWNPRSWSFGHFKPATSGDNSFSSSTISSFTEDADGNVWVGTFGGGINIVEQTTGSVRQIRKGPANTDSLHDDRVMALLRDRRGQVWAGTMTGGLSEVNPDTGAVRTFRHDASDPASLAANGVMSLFEDDAGRIWAGTFGGGVSRYDHATGKFTNFDHDVTDGTTLSSPRATTIVQDHSGSIWVGTEGGGLNYQIADSDSWGRLEHDPDDPNSLSANTVYALHVDARGRLWIGTRAGLDRLASWPPDGNGVRLLNVSTTEGLARTAVYGIQSDADSNLWLATSQGLISYNPDSGAIRNFHESQGLQSEEFTVGASYASPQGKLYFGGPNGFNAFDPTELQINQQPPAVVLTSLSVMNEAVESDRPNELIAGIDLKYSDYVVTFGISALDFTAPTQNRYAYKLEGFDESWVDAGSERRITYTNLDGGDYTFRVRASNSDGIWNDEGIVIPLSVAFPPWKTWWAYTLYVLAVVLAALAFWRHQEQKLAREYEYSRRLESEVQERTKQLDDRNKDLKDANVKLLRASTTDPLTGLHNRRFLYDQVSKDVDLVLRHYRDGTETMRPDGNNDMLFVMVDLDNFKPVNDNCGHEAGDELLLQVRDVLLEVCRTSDDVIRWGGDEFLVVARETDRRRGAALAERIRMSLSQRVFPVADGQVARITSSIGYASYPFLTDRPDLLSWEEVLGIADAAMYEAKQKRNAWLGIDGIEWDGSGDELYRAIKTDPGVLAEEGAIRALESVDDVAKSYA
jgi:diguanylate cyclase (GGDEF)-like protein